MSAERTIPICVACGRPRLLGQARDWNETKNKCWAEGHTETIEVTETQAIKLRDAAKAYHSAKGVEDRAAAMNDWTAVFDTSEDLSPLAEVIPLFGAVAR